MTPQERGRLGGRATHRKHGSAYMAMIGRRGFRAYVEKIYHGDAREHLLAAGRIGHPVRCQAYWKALIASGNIALSFDQWETEQRVIAARAAAREAVATITKEHAA